MNCVHLKQADNLITPSGVGCVECLRDGTRWVHLRVCLDCGHVGCCDSSPNRHATRHHEETGHPVIRSFEPGEDWRWCYVDEIGDDRIVDAESWLDVARANKDANGVEDRPSEQRFVIETDGHVAELVYRRVGRQLRLVHTGVPDELGGRGLGGKLVRAAIDTAEREDLTIVPWCPFARAWLEKHPDDAARVTIDWDLPAPT